MKKTYRIRANSPADYIRRALPFVGLLAVLVLCGIMSSWELGLL